MMKKNFYNQITVFFAALIALLFGGPTGVECAALTVISNPADVGKTEVAKRADNMLSWQAFKHPQWDQVLYNNARKWWLSFFLREKAGIGAPLGGNKVEWVEDGDWYEQRTIKSVEEISSDTYKICVNEDCQYFVLNDVVDLGVAYPGQAGLNLLGRVIEVQNPPVTPDYCIVVKLLDPRGTAVGVITALDFAIGQEITLLYNSQGECFLTPQGRTHSPEKRENGLTKISDTLSYCDDADNQEIWFKNPETGTMYWTPYEAKQTERMHMMKTDMALLFGQEHSFTDANGYEGSGGYGLIPWVQTNGFVRGFAGPAQETDFIEMLTQLGKYCDETDWHAFMGCELYKDAMVAFRPYFIGGGVYYGDFNGGVKEVGINFDRFRFGNKTITFMEYQGFSDPNFLPKNANGTNYDNFGLFLGLHQDTIKIRYKKKRTGEPMKAWLDHFPGTTFGANGGISVLQQACEKWQYTSHLGLQIKGRCHGLMIGD